ncbi:P-loop containing nucleoside triphosphate hydrolase protein [Entophlyctis helioformis]|nr:P-loop containing nucleoside triphosphate hydrolase protein [Entophlyctis helioformis]
MSSSLMDFQPIPVSVECRHLTFVVSAKKSVKTILDDLSFECAPGSLTALIGPSGAGKTSLMNLLARRSVHPEAEQYIYYGGRRLSKMAAKEFQRIVGFVPQHNPPFTGLTPTEVLLSYAKLELPAGTPAGQLTRRVSHILELLGLTSEQGGISGGQLRRMAVAVALLKQSSVLILDEPTSGLDARSSLEVMHILSRLSRQGYNIIVSIHQPRREIFDLFTDMILLAQGRLLFKGDPQECIRFAQAVQHAPSSHSTLSLAMNRQQQHEHDQQADQDAADQGNADVYLNPADAILDIIAAIPKAEIRDAVSLGSSWFASRSTSTSCHTNSMGRSSSSGVESLAATICHDSDDRSTLDMSKDDDKDSRSNPSSEEPSASKRTLSRMVSMSIQSLYNGPRIGTVGQLVVINARWWRKRPLLRKLFMLFLTLGATLVIGFLQRRPGSDMITLTLQIKGLALACIGLAALKNISIPSDYYDNRDVFNYDLANGSVHFAAFFLHRTIYETATSSLEATIAGILAYTLLGVSGSALRFATIITLIVMYYNTIVSLYTLIYGTRLSRPEALSISFLLQAVVTMTSGLWIKRGDTALYDLVSWIQDINPMYWMLSPLIRATMAGAGTCIVLDADQSECRAHTGDLVIEQARLEHMSPDRAVAVVVGLWMLLRCLQLVLLLRDAQLSKVWHWLRRTRRSAKQADDDSRKQ